MSISFDRAADIYDATRGFPAGVEALAAQTIASAGGLRGGERLLEIGVGTGRIALPLAAHVRQYVGVDISTSMMRRLQEKDGAGRVRLAQADATRLPFAADRFHAVVAVHVFHLIPGWRAVLEELRRVLLPAGCLIHCWNHNDQVIDIEATLKAALGDEHGRADAVGARGTTFLEEAGWRAGDEQICAFTRLQKPVEIVDNMRQRVWSRTWRLSDAALAAAAAALQTALQEKFADLHAPVEVPTSFHAKAFYPPGAAA
ncbi:MAG: class I SAM-dependent methyltransferase [Chloroflexi bacterium]|nr:class I SAM-dependent methyltransferase [Chloroflexota bacterium]